MKSNNQAQSEAPSVETLVEMIWASALDISTSKDFNTEAKYLKARENTLDHYSAKINRLIEEAYKKGYVDGGIGVINGK